LHANIIGVIHQCFFEPSQLQHVFQTEPYRPFGLEPAVNATLTSNCPELENADTRMALAEYGAMLHLWRNPDLDSDPWIGFTSYRQLTKTTAAFALKKDVEALLQRGEYLSWYMWSLAGVDESGLTGLAGHSEVNHPGIHRFILDIFAQFDIPLPRGFYDAPLVPFANYWVMSRERFDQFMQWSWPLLSYALSMSHPYLSSPSPLGKRDNKERAIGYFMERLFVLWTFIEKLKGVAVGALFGPDGKPIGRSQLGLKQA
jgi:hypothetical protein